MKIHIFDSKYRLDIPLIVLVLLLIGMGELLIYSATFSAAPGGDPYYYLKRQMLWFLVGLGAIVAVFLTDLRKLANYSVFFYAGNLLLLLLVFFFEGTLGAQRWIEVGPFNIQPSEFIKLVAVLILASYFAKLKGDVTARDIAVSGAYLALPLILILKQPDLGTALVLIAIYFGVLFIGGAKPTHIVALVVGGLLLFGAAVEFGVLKDYQMERLTVFLHPENDTADAGYNLKQSKIAIGSGQYFGHGLFSGSQSNLGFIPISYADFIFAVNGEKLGFMGAFILIGLFFLLLMRCLKTSAEAKDLYGTLIAGTIAVMWIFQIFVNIGMTIGLMPITGIPLPFISYGGSSLLTNLIAVGFLLNISADRFR